MLGERPCLNPMCASQWMAREGGVGAALHMANGRECSHGLRAQGSDRTHSQGPPRPAERCQRRVWPQPKLPGPISSSALQEPGRPALCVPVTVT